MLTRRSKETTGLVIYGVVAIVVVPLNIVHCEAYIEYIELNALAFIVGRSSVMHSLFLFVELF